jgi:RNA polymerase sigma-70 factor (ECF subfamily)
MLDDTGEAEHLIEQLRAGDGDALARLFDLHRPRLRRMIELRLDPRLGGRVSPSDVLQDTYLDASKRLRHFVDNPNMPFFVWVRLVAGQRLIDTHRQHLAAQARNVAHEVSIHGAVSAAASSVCLAADLAGKLSSPSHALERAETSQKLQEALESLEPLDREVLTLRHFEELSNRETAAVLGIETSAASKRYLRALERLKQVLASSPELFPSD